MIFSKDSYNFFRAGREVAFLVLAAAVGGILKIVFAKLAVVI